MSKRVRRPSNPAINGTATSARVTGSRARLLAAAKRLIAEQGYERVSTAFLAREAGTSESQLVRHFGSKAGLLGAVFDESWAVLNPRVVQVVANSPTAREATVSILSAMIHTLDRDRDLARLMFLEGRRIRRDTGEIFLSNGFQDFSARIVQLVKRGQRDGSFRKNLNAFSVTSAILGAAEGMVRDRLLAKRTYIKESDIQVTFEAMVSGLAP